MADERMGWKEIHLASHPLGRVCEWRCNLTLGREDDHGDEHGITHEATNPRLRDNIRHPSIFLQAQIPMADYIHIEPTVENWKRHSRLRVGGRLA
jgi:hypothetical protein